MKEEVATGGLRVICDKEVFLEAVLKLTVRNQLSKTHIWRPGASRLRRELVGNVLGGAGSVVSGGRRKDWAPTPGHGRWTHLRAGVFSECCGELKAEQHRDFPGFRRPFCPDVVRQQQGALRAQEELLTRVGTPRAEGRVKSRQGAVLPAGSGGGVPW